MKRIKLEVAYDGTDYCGWQIQPEDITIEKVLNDNLSQLLGEEIKVIGASRTDSGVHALGNVAVFDTKSKIPGERMAQALNARLPEDIIIQSSREDRQTFIPGFRIPRKHMNTHFTMRPLTIRSRGGTIILYMFPWTWRK